VPVRRILREVGITNVAVVKEQELPDPDFSTIKVPNPEDPAAFTLAMKLADQVHADVISAPTPTATAWAWPSRQGGQVPAAHRQPDRLRPAPLHPLHQAEARHPAEKRRGGQVHVSTSLANRICEHYGVAMFETLTGFKFIGEKIQQFQDTGSHTFLFGFEESYGFLSSTFVRDKDGVNASLLIAEAAASVQGGGRDALRPGAGDLAQYGYFVEKVVSTIPCPQGRRGPHEGNHAGAARASPQGNRAAARLPRAGLSAGRAGRERPRNPHWSAHLRRALL
jgi:phosphoglucomutase